MKMKLDQSYLGSTILLLQIALSFIIAWNISSWLVKSQKNTACSYQCTSVQLGEHYQMMTPKVEIWFISMEMELRSWFFVHTKQPNPPTSGHENGGFLRIRTILPKFVTSFQMLEVGTRYLKSLRLFMSAIQVLDFLQCVFCIYT